jgi:hypothetical protein
MDGVELRHTSLSLLDTLTAASFDLLEEHGGVAKCRRVGDGWNPTAFQRVAAGCFIIAQPRTVHGRRLFLACEFFDAASEHESAEGGCGAAAEAHPFAGR